MTEPKSEQGNGTRDRILAAAATVLARNGYAGTRLSDIARCAELRAPAMYYYFSSREELIGEVMVVGQRWVRTHVSDALAALPGDATSLDRIDAAVEAHLRVELELSDFARAVSRNSGQLPPDMHAPVAAESAQYHALWRGLLEQGRQDGSIRADLDLRTARMLVVGALNWAAEWWDRERGSVTEVIMTAQLLVRGGLAA
ncbi:MULTISPECIES: TetR/AcrR family transcriptional regulator [unclassified Nocardia]|uniref:TetR/AcrR family transcriptional regulator n=1 Tax=unclassified Nocardia TaxID=2637762 RepID=UPI0035E316EC